MLLELWPPRPRTACPPWLVGGGAAGPAQPCSPPGAPSRVVPVPKAHPRCLVPWIPRDSSELHFWGPLSREQGGVPVVSLHCCPEVLSGSLPRLGPQRGRTGLALCPAPLRPQLCPGGRSRALTPLLRLRLPGVRKGTEDLPQGTAWPPAPRTTPSVFCPPGREQLSLLPSWIQNTDGSLCANSVLGVCLPPPGWPLLDNAIPPTPPPPRPGASPPPAQPGRGPGQQPGRCGRRFLGLVSAGAMPRGLRRVLCSGCGGGAAPFLRQVSQRRTRWPNRTKCRRLRGKGAERVVSPRPSPLSTCRDAPGTEGSWGTLTGTARPWALGAQTVACPGCLAGPH